MKIAFVTAAFAEAAKAITPIVSPSLLSDLLGHARIEVRKGKEKGKMVLSLAMSNLDMDAAVEIDCTAEGEVLAAIPAAVLDFFAIRADSEEEGTLTFEGENYFHRVTARHGKARMSLPILKGDDFPLLGRKKDPEWSMTMRAHEFCAALKRTEKAVAPDGSSYPQLVGPYLHLVDGMVTAISADGNRIHIIDLGDLEVTGKMPQPTAAKLPGIIIPPGAVKEILRVFSGDESEIVLSGTRFLAIVEGKRIKLSTKLIDATYIDYQRMIPARLEPKITVQADRLMRAISGLLVVPKTEAKGKKVGDRTIRITAREAAIELTAEGDNGDAEDVIEATVEAVDPGTFWQFHSKFLRDAVDAAGSKTVSLHPSDEIGKPFHLSGADGATFFIGQRAR